jgi:hypothetical protein
MYPEIIFSKAERALIPVIMPIIAIANRIGTEEKPKYANISIAPTKYIKYFKREATNAASISGTPDLLAPLLNNLSETFPISNVATAIIKTTTI